MTLNKKGMTLDVSMDTSTPIHQKYAQVGNEDGVWKRDKQQALYYQWYKYTTKRMQSL